MLECNGFSTLKKRNMKMMNFIYCYICLILFS